MNEVLRNWRNRGFMDDLGTKQPNGRWTYSAREAMTIWVMGQMVSVGMSNSAAMTGAAVITGNILRDPRGFMVLRGAREAAIPNETKVPERYFLMYLDNEWVLGTRHKRAGRLWKPSPLALLRDSLMWG